MLQLSFAATAATIDSGAVAERMNFKPYVILSTLISGALLRPHRRPAPPASAAADRRWPPAGFFYPLACHWCWDPNGWLSRMGYHDFAGSGPVHLMGGASALVAAWYIGPRVGRFHDKKEKGTLSLTVPPAPVHTTSPIHPSVWPSRVRSHAEGLRRGDWSVWSARTRALAAHALNPESAGLQPGCAGREYSQAEGL
jgi:hypothetical protein